MCGIRLGQRLGKSTGTEFLPAAILKLTQKSPATLTFLRFEEILAGIEYQVPTASEERPAQL
jgi:hypothetical protein